MGFSLYVHIPFCLRKCRYCDFPSSPYPGGAAGDAYLDDLERELNLRRAPAGPLVSVYIGGGTPTCLSARQLERLLALVRAFRPWRPGAEVTVEANPGTLDGEKLAVLRNGGANRLSLGVQSFSPRLLRAMGRVHGPEEAGQAVRLARQAGFANINLDLIFGLPGQTRREWQETLARALDLQPEHLSLYALELEEETPWGRLHAAGRLQPAGEEESLAMYRQAQDWLTAAGYHQYEISNFARPGLACRHNLAYWRREPYLGAGVAAASQLGHRRFSNERRLAGYRRRLRAGRLPVAVVEDLGPADERAEAMFLGLRLTAGVDLAEFRRRYGVDAEEVFGKAIAWGVSRGLLEVRQGRLRLTERGLPLGNEVFQAFLPG